MDWPSAGSGRTQTLSSTTRASSRPRTVRRARRRSSSAQRRSSGSGVCRSTAAAASSASRCSRPPGCGRRPSSGVCTSRTGPGGVTGPTRTTRPGAVEPGVSQGTSGTGMAARKRARSGVQRPAQHTTSSASRTAPAAVRTRGAGARLQAGHPARLAGADVRAVALRPGDQAGDQRFGQQVALAGEERGRGVGRDAQRGLERGGLGRVDEAGRVAPSGQALHPGFEFGGAAQRSPARRGRRAGTRRRRRGPARARPRPSSRRG